MPSDSFKISNLDSVIKQLKLEALAQVNDAIELIIDSILPEIGEAFVNRLRDTETYQSLSGSPDNIDNDLEAHLGLEPGQGIEFIERMGSIIADTVAISSTRLRSGGRFASVANADSASFKIDFVDVEYALLSAEGASYDSEKANIPWVKWLFFGGGGVSGYEIKFIENISDADARAYLEEISRSHKAIMYKTPNNNWSTGYYDIFSESDGLIAQILTSAEFVNDIQNLIVKEMERRV